MAGPTLTIEAGGEEERALPPLPAVDFLTGRGFVTGKSGSGKSNSVSVLIEEMLSGGLAVLVVDTDGEYYGLKEEHEVLHVGADETCDLQVGPEHAPRLAELALRQNVPVILDLSAYLSAEEARRLVAETCGALFQREQEARRPFPIFVEEIHEFLPQQTGLDEAGRTLVRVAKRGRKRGLGLCGISQRPASVRKDFITQCDYILWHRLTWDNDTRVAGRVAGKEAARQVPELGNGEALFMADFLEGGAENRPYQRVQVRLKRTFDAGATPGLGEKRQPALKELGAGLAEELEQISRRKREEKTELERLRSENERLEEETRRLEEEVERQKDVTRLAERFASAMEHSAGNGGSGGGDSSGSESGREAIERVRGEAREALAEVRREKREAEKKSAQLEEELQAARERIHKLEEKAQEAEHGGRLRQHLPEMQEAVERLAEGLGMEAMQQPAGGPGGAPAEKVRERARQLSARVEKLEEELRRARSLAGAGAGAPSERANGQAAAAAAIAPSVEEFVRAPCVQRGIERAKEGVSSRYVDGILRALLQGRETVTYERVAKRLGLKTTSHVSTAARALEEQGVAVLFGRPREIELNLSGLGELRAAKEAEEHADALMAGL